MKNSIWDILTGIVLLGILCMIGGFGVILINPNVAFNPLRPGSSVPELVPTIALPPTWTPAAQPVEQAAPDSGSQPTQETAGDSAGAVPTLRPSSTPLPTATAFSLPTFTRPAPTRAGTSGGRCLVTSQNPQDGSSFSPGATIPVAWTIRNTSQDTWRADSVDLRFVDGTKMHRGPDAFDLNEDVANNANLEIRITMYAPDETGSYTSNWAMYAGDKSVCRFYLQIRVRNSD